MFTPETYRNLLLLGALREHVEAILHSSIPWDGRYRMVFSDRVSGQMLTLIRAIEGDFSWYDPDADYEDDVRAFISAVDDFLARQRKQLHALSVEETYALFEVVMPTSAPA